jgi:Zn-dependent protease
VECQTCGQGRDHTVLYRCQYCQSGHCDEHINNHKPCFAQQQFNQQQPQQYNPQTQFRQFTPFGITTSQYHRPVRREPTNEEYEYFLQSNPEILTSGKESGDLLLGFLLLVFFVGFRPLVNGLYTWQYVLVLSVVIGPAFILHELGHKYAAIHYGKYARFTLIRRYAMWTLFFGFVGFGIAGPGATVILGRSSKEENGKFAAAGPAINFILAMIIIGISLITEDVYFSSLGHSLDEILALGILINAILGLFNLLPFLMLDGKKILNWNQLVWVSLVALNGLMLYARFTLF